MKFRTAGTDWNHIPLPIFEGEGGGGAGGGGEPNGNGDGKQAAEGSFVWDAGKAFEGLGADNLEWLQKNEGLMADPKALAKHAFNQEKLVGSAIRVPGKDATPEEREAFLNKLGRPETPDKYAVKQPENMPEGLPYDGDRAKRYAAIAHKAGLTNEQFAALHDALVAEEIGAFSEAGKSAEAKMTERAVKATEDLVKLWGPIDGATAKANFEIADKAFTMLPGGPELLGELKSLGLIGPNKEILSVPLAKAFAAVGTALYTEDGNLRGSPDVIGNVFDEKAPEYNVTAQHKLVREDPAKARSLIAAAGKKPEDFGLPANLGA